MKSKESKTWYEIPAGYKVANFCRSCGKDFGSMWAFDLHRTGKPGNRRCLTDKEMELKGFHLDSNHRYRAKTKPQNPYTKKPKENVV